MIYYNLVLYSYMSFLYFMWSRNLLKLYSATSKKTTTTRLGENTYKNEWVAYLHNTCVNHAKVIKAKTLKVALMKGINLNRPRDFWLYFILTNEKSICNFYKSCWTWNLIEKKQRKWYIHSLDSKLIWLMLHPKMN